ncbi:hypothetical protein [Geodermatophilus sabuli]|uniref:Uncharacterized protein n=1 Tax=Geodermatophilus sabuli TaxID=1564158 RepID=A0A285EIB4_9ACTN|nr:hypothetical protein [Geodermatophilus sabuli]MBB3086876.1 hypothetical protein [Geodermatophilus sabuli]SNX98750.1 hypothetical protein SAMN06893097_11245 [Geodermatophilus sabuli]
MSTHGTRARARSSPVRPLAVTAKVPLSRRSREKVAERLDGNRTMSNSSEKAARGKPRPSSVMAVCCSTNAEPAKSANCHGSAATGNSPVARTATGTSASPRVRHESNQADRE